MNTNQTAKFQASTRVVYGPGSVAAIGDLAQELGVGRVLVVTDVGVSRAGICARVMAALTGAGVDVTVFDAVEPNPSMETVAKAWTLYRESGRDGVVAVGGGSPIDAAKAVATLATNPGQLSAYIGVGKISQALAPLLAVPTTVGTGSEVTTWAVITDLAQRKKVVLGSPLLAPRVAVLDPELVLSLPAGLTASTGIDALTHAIESVISVFAGPFTDGLALEAIRLISSNLPAAVSTPGLEPRSNLLYASAMAGMAFSYGRTGLVHGMAHPLSAYCNVPHGLANAILLPYVLAFNLPACVGQLARVGAAMGIAGSEDASAQGAVEAVRRLNAQVGIPPRLSDVGATENFIPQMARDAYESGNAQVVNPRKPTYEQVVELYRLAM
jgi:alcohol dehydrogenase class IV